MSEIIVPFQSAPLLLEAAFSKPFWQKAARVSLRLDWRGELAPPALPTTALCLWTAEQLCLGFECGYTELDVDQSYDLRLERAGLWERDVCEAFIRSPLEPHAGSYKEFEVAPTGQWLDVQIHRPRVVVDWDWQSGMRTASAIDEGAKIWRAAMAIPFAAFGVAPQPGDVWQANLFRISRWQGARQYLAFSPTLTAAPDFHVPERFVALRFSA